MPITAVYSVILLVSLVVFSIHSAGAETSAVPESNQKKVQVLGSAEQLLKRYFDKIQQSMREVVLIELVDEAGEPNSSRVGGDAYLPVGHALPVDAAGHPMFLLAQINFSEVPSIKDLPTTGLLQIFIGATQFYGANFDGARTEENLSKQVNFRFIFHEDPEAKKFVKHSVGPPGEYLPHDPFRPHRMRFTRNVEPISPGDVGFEHIFGRSFYRLVEQLAHEREVDENQVHDVVAGYLGRNDFKHKLGGYPSFTQKDPRAPTSTLKLLLQLSSDEVLMWCDSGVANFFIDPEALRKRDFTKVLYNWDCT